MSEIALRPFLPADLPVLTAIFRDSIEELTGDEYDDDQRAAWAAQAEDESFGERLSGALTLIATYEGFEVGFASLKDNVIIDMLYVHPQAARQGTATTLIDALEKLALARGASELTSEVSDTARGFFEARGYAAHSRNSVMLNGEWFANTTMKKTLAGNDNKASQLN